MPYAIRRTKKKRYVVYKKHGDKQIIGHTKSRRMAIRMISAIYAHEHGYEHGHGGK